MPTRISKIVSQLDVTAGTACKATESYPKLESLPYAGSGYEFALIDQTPTCNTEGTGDFNQVDCSYTPAMPCLIMKSER